MKGKGDEEYQRKKMELQRHIDGAFQVPVIESQESLSEEEGGDGADKHKSGDDLPRQVLPTEPTRGAHGGLEVLEVDLRQVLGGYAFPVSASQLPNRGVANAAPAAQERGQDTMNPSASVSEVDVQVHHLEGQREAVDPSAQNNTVAAHPLEEIDVNIPRVAIGIVHGGSGVVTE